MYYDANKVHNYLLARCESLCEDSVTVALAVVRQAWCDQLYIAVLGRRRDDLKVAGQYRQRVRNEKCIIYTHVVFMSVKLWHKHIFRVRC